MPRAVAPPRKTMTNEKRQALWETLLLRCRNGELADTDISYVAGLFNVSYWTAWRIWGKGMATMSLGVPADVRAKWHERGRRKVNRAALCHRLRQVPVAERLSQRFVQHSIVATAYMVNQLLKEGYLRRALKQTRPLLTEKHHVDRMRFCLRHVWKLPDGTCEFVGMYDTVRIDEKWFYIKTLGSKVYVLTGLDGLEGELPPCQYVQSKRYIIKVMFLCAVARPRDGWDGKIGMWPVTKTYITQRASKNRPAGVKTKVPIFITRPVSRMLLLKKVIPAIKAKWPSYQKEMVIRIQQDNAKPHVLENDPAVQAAGTADGWMIVISPSLRRVPTSTFSTSVFLTASSLSDPVRARAR